MDTKLKSWLISVLRKASYSHKPRNEAKKLARIAPSTYECAKCGIWIYDGKKDIAKLIFEKETIQGKIYLDHIDPIVPIRGWDSWDNYFKRLFCGVEGFQVLCYNCNKQKTDNENEARKQYRRKK